MPIRVIPQEEVEKLLAPVVPKEEYPYIILNPDDWQDGWIYFLNGDRKATGMECLLQRRTNRLEKLLEEAQDALVECERILTSIAGRSMDDTKTIGLGDWCVRGYDALRIENVLDPLAGLVKGIRNVSRAADVRRSTRQSFNPPRKRKQR